MSLVKTALDNLKGFLQDHHLSFTNGLLILFTIGGEQIFQATAFDCPCTQPRAAVYGLAFLIVPAIVLGVMGIAVSNLTWRVLHGCCYRSKESKNVPHTNQSQGQESAPDGPVERQQEEIPGGSVKNGHKHSPDEAVERHQEEIPGGSVKNGHNRAPGGPVGGEQKRIPGGPVGRGKDVRQVVLSNGCRKASVSLCIVFARSLIVPVAWLCLAFLDGGYYSCIRSSEPCKKVSEENKAWKEESQIISWCLLLVVVVFSFIVIGITRCLDSVTYSEYRYISTYRQVEECQFDRKIQTYTGELANERIEKFVTKNPRTKEDWDAIALAPNLSGSSLSPLDEWSKIQPETQGDQQVTQQAGTQGNQPVPQQAVTQFN